MKAKALIMALCLTGIAATSNAQMKTVRTKTQPAAFSPVQKGYYTIGRNGDKLNAAPSVMTVGESGTGVQKGYYAIGKNRNKFGHQQVVDQNNLQPASPAKTVWPVKGYYGIGKNAEKLK